MSSLRPRSAPRLPDGFEELLQGMAREVLRAQPHDVLGFVTRYFQALLAERERCSAARRTEDAESRGAEEAAGGEGERGVIRSGPPQSCAPRCPPRSL